MAKRSYQQHCALAKALDLVGERWTLLLVRELLTGPKRYKQLIENLPGMGTNLLAARLRDLQGAELVAHDGTSYSLTERGAELEESVVALARWGSAALAEPIDGELWRASWNVIALKYAFRSDLAKDVVGVIEYRIDDTRVQARIKNGTIATSAEESWKPDVVIEANGETLLALSRGELKPKEAEASGALAVSGDRRLFRSSLRVFRAK